MPRAKRHDATEVKPTTGVLSAVNTDTEVSVKNGRKPHKTTAKVLSLAKSGHSVPDIAAATGLPKKRVYNMVAYHGVKITKVKSAKPLLTSKDILKLIRNGIKPTEISKEYGIPVQRVYNCVSYYKTHKVTRGPGRPHIEHLELSKKDVEEGKQRKTRGISITVNLSNQQVNAIVAQAARAAAKLIDVDILVDKAVREWSRRMVHTANA